jgi:uncharacterized protein (UPF0303 family)
MATSGGYSSEQLAAEASDLVFEFFALDDAIALGELATALASERELPIVIEVRLGARVAYRAALPGTTANNDEWLIRKFRLVQLLETSTLAARVAHEERDRDFNETTGLSPLEYAAHGGGWPIMVRGVGMVGCYGISGLPHVDDHTFIVETLGLLKDGGELA